MSPILVKSGYFLSEFGAETAPARRFLKKIFIRNVLNHNGDAPAPEK